ncbi:MBL fold metallo-hydrolase [Modestobacter sp. NPDC049651]|uniref:MBL fold metallo-hydrolase n=1 Tax=unclassified Modestobacter TaxID=2643866 RepID=UPI0033EF69A8
MTSPTDGRLSRRSLFTLTGGAVLAAGVAGAGPVQAAPAPGPAGPATVPATGMHVVTLGTAAGPAVRGPRAGIATAVVVDGDVYLVDCGLGVTRQVKNAGLTMDRLRGIFLTHLHSDHTSELPALLLYNWGPAVSGITQPLPIIGPGQARLPRGAAVHVQPATGGTRRLVADLLSSYAYDVNIRVFDEDRPPLEDLLLAREIDLPRGVHADPDRHPCPPMEPFEVYRDEHVRVLATLVDHPPVFPAFAFRFESAHGAVVLSGDTTEHPNTVRLAQDADVLVHEAIDLDYYLAQDLPEAYVQHLADSHTDLEGAGRVAAQAGVGALVLSHLGGIFTDADADRARAVFARTTVADDGQVFSVAG